MKDEKITKFYRLTNILKLNADYNIIFGERSSGKTFACLEYGVEHYYKNGTQMAYIRRQDEDFKQGRAQQLFNNLVFNDTISKVTNKKWSDVYYKNRCWYLCKYDKEGNRIVDSEPFCFGFTIAQGFHDKSVGFPNVKTIVFDEFISRFYLQGEFIDFNNLLSTIIRYNDDVKIFMLANSQDKYGCIYFEEMGLKHVKEMKRGDIDLYTFDKLRIAVEYTKPNESGKPSDKYFAFDNPKLKMISEGLWETAVYPHLTEGYRKSDVLQTFFIVHQDHTLQADVIVDDTKQYIFIHRKTTPIKDDDEDIIFTFKDSLKPNYFKRLTRPTCKLQERILRFFRRNKVYYQDNDVGEVVRSYIMTCDNSDFR